MEEESAHLRGLIAAAAVLCALIIGYNAFYVPDALPVTVTADMTASSVKNEEYTPAAPQPSASAQSFAPRSSALQSAASSLESGTVSVSAPAGKVNLNTATAQQMSDALAGIGPVIAKRIVEYREKNGKFRSVEEIKNVSGIGEKTFEKLKGHITVG